MKKMQGIADRTNFNRAGTHQVNTLYCPKQPKWQIRPKIPDYEKMHKKARHCRQDIFQPRKETSGKYQTYLVNNLYC